MFLHNIYNVYIPYMDSFYGEWHIVKKIFTKLSLLALLVLVTGVFMVSCKGSDDGGGNNPQDSMINITLHLYDDEVISYSYKESDIFDYTVEPPSGVVFKGWYTSADYSRMYSRNNIKDGDHLYGKFVAIYQVTVHNTHPLLANSFEVITGVEEGKTFSSVLSNYSQYDYVFSGFYYDKSLLEAVVMSDAIQQSIVVYIKWEAVYFNYSQTSTEVTITGLKASATVRTSIYIPEEINGKKVTQIAANAFKGNSYVQTVYIGSNVAYIGFGAFRNCSVLRSVTINRIYPPSLGGLIFDNCPQLSAIYIPMAMASIYNYYQSTGFIAYRWMLQSKYM